jgi:hypothetical protein
MWSSSNSVRKSLWGESKPYVKERKFLLNSERNGAGRGSVDQEEWRLFLLPNLLFPRTGEIGLMGYYNYIFIISSSMKSLFINSLFSA